jgi:hypothetical protein
VADWVDAFPDVQSEHTLAYERTKEELALIRTHAAGWYDGSYTCDGCSRRYCCRLVFGAFNTHGYCLCEK